MADKMVTLATFSNPVEAELAKGHLEAEGIPAFLMGDLGGGMFAGMSNLFGEIRLMVAEPHAERALDVLDATADDAEAEHEGSTATKSASPEEGSSTRVRAPIASPLQDHPPPAEVPAEDTTDLPTDEDMLPDDEREERSLTWTADDVAARALRAAIFGFLTGGLLSLYALWLVIRLPSAEGELSPAGARKAWAAFALAVLPAGVLILLVLGLVIGLVAEALR